MFANKIACLLITVFMFSSCQELMAATPRVTKSTTKLQSVFVPQILTQPVPVNRYQYSYNAAVSQDNVQFQTQSDFITREEFEEFKKKVRLYLGQMMLDGTIPDDLTNLDSTAPQNNQLWRAVENIVNSRCKTCHSQDGTEKPNFYVDGDLKKDLNWDRIGILAITQKMPPDGGCTPEEASILLQYANEISGGEKEKPAEAEKNGLIPDIGIQPDSDPY